MKIKLIALALLAVCHGAWAQRPPSGGALIPPPPPAPPARAAPEIRIEPRAAPPAPDAPQARIVVDALRVTGAQLYSEAQLLALTGFTPGSELTLADLQAMAGRITEHYRRSGYFAAQAYLPAQDIRDRTVTIAVSEGRLGQVQLRNSTNLRDHVANHILRGLDSGEVLATPEIESRLLLLSDLPGVNVKSTLAPGASAGTSDLAVDITPGRRVTGSIDFDNAGNYYTGAYRLGAVVNVNNPLGLGDVFSLRGLTSGSGLQYGRASYQVQAGRGQVGVAYSGLRYELGKEFESLQAHGTAQIASLYGRYPVVRSRSDNLWVQLGFDWRTYEDRIDSVGAVVDRSSRVFLASLYGDHVDGFGGGGANTYFLAWSAGDLDIETPGVRDLDAATARTNGNYNKLAYGATRVQQLGPPFSLFAGIHGQLASKNLDVSEKMQLGGMYAVRAYPDGEAYADQGYVVTLEGRMELPQPQALPGRMQLVAFVDYGRVTFNRDPWAPGDNNRSLSGAGIGWNWEEPGNFLVRASYAHKLGNERATSSPDRSGRFWIQMVKFF